MLLILEKRKKRIGSKREQPFDVTILPRTQEEKKKERREIIEGNQSANEPRVPLIKLRFEKRVLICGTITT